MTTNNTTTKVPANAKVKKPSTSAKAMGEKALRRAVASAAKKLPSLTLDSARATFANAAYRDESACTAYAMTLNARFGSVLTDHRVHWSDVWASDNAKAEGSNYRPIWQAIESERQDLFALLTGKHSNPAQVWKRARDKAFAIACPGQQRERKRVAPHDKAKKAVIAAYRALMKETMPSDDDLKAAEAIGELLIAAFKVDLSKLNV